MKDMDGDLKRLEGLDPWDWPAVAYEVLLGSLRDESAGDDDRMLAARLAGDPVVANDALIEALAHIMSSERESEALRGQAAIALGPTLETADTDGLGSLEDVSERTYRGIVEALRNLYRDPRTPKLVRRRALEASVRAPDDWHRDAIVEAFASDDPEWRLTAVFCMRWVRGFDEQILEAIGSDDEDLCFEAVLAAGNWQVEAAWPRIKELLSAKGVDKGLVLAAIEAAAEVNPAEAGMFLVELAESEDEDIAEAATEAMVMAEAIAGEGLDIEFEEDLDEDEDDDFRA